MENIISSYFNVVEQLLVEISQVHSSFVFGHCSPVNQSVCELGCFIHFLFSIFEYGLICSSLKLYQ